MMTLPQRMLDKLRLNRETGCWVWSGQTYRSGYGMVKWQGKKRSAHRVTYLILVGEIPDGLHIDHLCRVRSCVNPAHMETVTPRENILRGTSPWAENAAKTHCKNGHELTQENCQPKAWAEGKRECRICHSERGAAWRAEQLVKQVQSGTL